MKFFFYFIVAFLLMSCSKPDPKEYANHLSGYWEIKKVITALGEEKDYNFNQSIDFIELTDTIGIRKKVQPQLDDTFITTNDVEKFSIRIEKDSLRLYYSTVLSNWKETVISAKEDELVILNEAGNLYFYAPYKKLEL